VREGEEGEGDPEIEEKVGVERVAVLCGVDGQVPEAVGGRDGLGRLHGLIVECRMGLGLCLANDVKEELVDAGVVGELGVESGGEESALADEGGTVVARG
jgi:hypothetical protein